MDGRCPYFLLSFNHKEVWSLIMQKIVGLLLRGFAPSVIDPYNKRRNHNFWSRSYPRLMKDKIRSSWIYQERQASELGEHTCFPKRKFGKELIFFILINTIIRHTFDEIEINWWFIVSCSVRYIEIVGCHHHDRTMKMRENQLEKLKSSFYS